MEENHPECRCLFPSNRYSPLTDTVVLDPERHITRRTVHNIVTRTETGRLMWPHLFRETQGARVVRRHGDTIVSIFAVKRRLDLENPDTALRYVERYGTDLIQPEETPLDVAK